jgi:hypothetical protein
MLNLSEPVHLYRSQRESRQARRFWICEWGATGVEPMARGVFVVEAGHYLDAKQTAKKALRDDLARACDFTYAVRLASLLERAQLKFAPARSVLETKMPVGTPAPCARKFAGESPADSTSKT